MQQTARTLPHKIRNKEARNLNVDTGTAAMKAYYAYEDTEIKADRWEDR